jgi:hypothetical protein
MDVSQQFLPCRERETGEFFKKIIMESKLMYHSEQEVVNGVPSQRITSTKMFKTAVSTVKIIPTIVWYVKGVEYSEFMPTGKPLTLCML